MEHLSKSTEPLPSSADITLETDTAALVGAELDASYGRAPTAEGGGAVATVRVNPEGITVERAGAALERVARARVSGAWFVPQFVERALGLSLGGLQSERPIVVTADFVGWLVFVVDENQWLCVATNERDRALAAIDALGFGPLAHERQWTLFEPSDRAATGARWLRSQTHVRRAMGATVASSVALDAALGYLGSLVALSVVTVAGAMVVFSVTLARRAIAQQLSRWSVDPREQRAVIERPGAKPQRFDLRKIEGARLTRTGFVLEYEDAPRPVAIDVLEPTEGARASEGSRVELARLRVAHTFVDHAIATRDALKRRA